MTDSISMKIKIKKRYIILTFLVLLLVYLFWGPLFPWSPIKPGFHKIESDQVTVFIDNFSKKDSLLYDIKQIMSGEEAFHGLKFKDKVKIIILSEDSNMKRFLPWMEGTGFSVSLSMVNLIYIGSTARKSEYGYLVYLKHELSHELIRQHTSTENAFETQEQGWMAEGLATYYGGPDYYSKAEFIDLCLKKQIKFDNLLEQNPLKIPRSDIWFTYTYYRYFIDFLIEKYGLGKLQIYLKKYLNNPYAYKDMFVEIYSKNYLEILTEYQNLLF